MLNILHPRRPSTASSQTSSSSFFHRRSPSPEPESFRHHHHHQQSQARYSRSASTCSTRSCENMGDDSRRQLWRAMLLLQQEYGCYHSARIDLALSSGEDGLSLMPNGFIIDTLNDSIHDLPEEGWAMLDPFFHPANELHV